MSKCELSFFIFIFASFQLWKNVESQSSFSSQYSVTIEEKEILILPEKVSFKKAKELCKSKGYNLVNIENEESNKLIYDMAVKNNVGRYWINVNDMKDEGRFLDTNGQRLRYKNFAKGEPNNLLNEDCVHGLFYPNALWNDISCSDVNSVICSKERSKDTETKNTTFQIHPRRVIYQDALEFCQKHHCRIVKIDDHTKNNIVLEIAKNEKIGTFWINGNDIVTEGRWLDSNGKELKYTNWHKGEPNNLNNEDCIQGSFFDDGGWNDQKCDEKNAFIYEYEEVTKQSNLVANLVQGGKDISRKYFVHAGKVTYQEALDYCQIHDCQMVTVQNSKIDNSLRELANKYSIDNYWLDGSDFKVEGSWVNSEGEKLPYLNWKEGQPNNWLNEDCILGNYFGDGKWNDISCDSRNSFIYEFTDRIVKSSELILLPEIVSYLDAKSLCEKKGYTMVTIDSEETNQMVNYFARKNKIGNYWIGANDMKVEGVFFDNDNNAIKYSKFYIGEPNNNGNEDCVQGSFLPYGFWNDVSCNSTNSVICMKYSPPIVTVDEHTNFHIYKQKVTYEEALKLCKSTGYDLLEIEDTDENVMAVNLRAKYNLESYWIDGTDVMTEGKWLYSFGDPVKYTNWVKGGGGLDKEKNCIYSSKELHGKWQDVSCSSRHSAICYEDSLELLEEEAEEFSYFIHKEKLTFKEALSYCQKSSCKLVTIYERDTDIKIRNLAKSLKIEKYWIDGSDIKKEGTWLNSEGRILTYFNWNDGKKVIDPNHNCLVASVETNGKWKDVSCDEKNSFIFQIVIDGEQVCDDRYI